MRIDIATLFPELCEAVLSYSMMGRARKSQLVEFHCHNIRDYTLDKHRRVDDAPYGGGKGMLLQADPIYRCYDAVCRLSQATPPVIYLSPQGQVLTQALSMSYAKLPHLFLLCGHYEGVDERALEELAASELSIGDYVLTGGELPALVLIDSVVRLLDGVLASKECFEQESHYHGLLEHPQYTRPAVWHDRPVPPVLLSGHHQHIADWQAAQALEKTRNKRPDLLAKQNAKTE